MSYRFNPLTGNFDLDTRGVVAGPSPIEDTIPALSLKTIDTQAKAGFSVIYYQFTLVGTGAVLSFQSAVFNEAGGISDQLYSRAGSLNLSYDVVDTGLNVELQVNNPNNFEIEVLYFRTLI